MQIETDADVMWKPDVRETDAEIAERGYRFLQVVILHPAGRTVFDDAATATPCEMVKQAHMSRNRSLISRYGLCSG